MNLESVQCTTLTTTAKYFVPLPLREFSVLVSVPPCWTKTGVRNLREKAFVWNGVGDLGGWVGYCGVASVLHCFCNGQCASGHSQHPYLPSVVPANLQYTCEILSHSGEVQTHRLIKKIAFKNLDYKFPLLHSFCIDNFVPNSIFLAVKNTIES